ncbi:MAG: hypothetical protein L3J39_12340 [Verrucomicrobiales bacterium]|nr:hypothetical protein [Verrucomicrobiales bacterium]
MLIAAKVRAAKRGNKLKEVIAEALERGLDAMEKLPKSKAGNARIFEPEDGSLAYVICETLGSEKKRSVDETLRLEQEILLQEDLRDAGFTA